MGLTNFFLSYDSSNENDIVPLAILDDRVAESIETLSVYLAFRGPPVQRVFLSPNHTKAEIYDNDGKCRKIFYVHNINFYMAFC